MARQLYCTLCDASVTSMAGDVPRYCPHCHRAARWSTMAPAPDPIEPVKPSDYTFNDRRFLHRIGIEAD